MRKNNSKDTRNFKKTLIEQKKSLIEKHENYSTFINKYILKKPWKISKRFDKDLDKISMKTSKKNFDKISMEFLYDYVKSKNMRK